MQVRRGSGSSWGPFIVGAIYTGPHDKGQRVLQPLRELGTPLLDLGSQMPFRMFQAAFDSFFPEGQLASYWKSVCINELTDDLIDLAVPPPPEPERLPVRVHTVVTGGMPGWYITLTAVGSALAAAALALLLDRAWAAHRRTAAQAGPTAPRAAGFPARRAR